MLLKFELPQETVQYILDVLTSTPLPFNKVSPIVNSIVSQANNQPAPVEVQPETTTQEEVK